MDMDRFTRGFIAGVIGGVAMNLWNLVVLFLINWDVITYIEWAGIMIFGSLPRSHAEGLIALLMQISFVGVLGISFAFLIPHVTSQAYLFKGVVYGVAVGFFIYAIPTLFQVPVLKETSLATVISDIVGASVWGLVMAKTLHWLDKRKITD
jgi:uncharacterized membrane protein